LVAIFALTQSAQTQRPGGARPMLPVQAALDANSDSVIAGDEMNNAPAALRKLDKTAMGN
jgi:hypothetical protein